MIMSKTKENKIWSKPKLNHNICFQITLFHFIFMLNLSEQSKKTNYDEHVMNILVSCPLYIKFLIEA